jgi:hypothetical protein
LRGIDGNAHSGTLGDVRKKACRRGGAVLATVAALAIGSARAADPEGDRPIATVPAAVAPPGEMRPESDETLEVAVSHELANDDRVNPMQVKVAVKHGTVTLTGTAKDLDEKEAAEKVVRRVRGVRQVENKIQLVEPGAPAPGASVIPEVPAAH